MSPSRLPWVVKGLVPASDCFLILSVAAVTTAVSGRPAVLKCRIPTYCRLAASSPTEMVGRAAFVVPPFPLVSDDSRTQPS
jgi:hypothetical protein